ncbi:MAG: FtsX-like permease family protein, partial [Pirellula sp.]
MEQGLRLAIAFALVIAGLVIYNTFQMNIGERRRQLGILRSLGATRKQLLWMIVREGLWLGTVGTLLGCIVGHFGAAILRSTTGRLLQIDVPQAGWSIWPYLVAAICGLVISFLGAFFPAVRAARMSPAEAMRVVATGEFGTSRSGWLAAGGILISTGLALQFLAIAGFIDVSNVVPGAVSMMLGVVFLLPGVVSDLTYAVTFVLGPILKTEGKLARRQLLRHRGRTSLTIGIVFIALGLGLGMASTILDNVRNVEGWHQRAIVGDFFVRAAMPDMNSGQAAEMPDGLLEQVRNMEGVNLVDSLDFVQSRIGETSVVVVVRNFSAESQDYFDLAEGKEA